MNKKIILGILLVLLACCGIYAGVSNNNSIDDISVNTAQIDTENLEEIENYAVTENANLEKKLFSTDKPDTNSILIENNTTLDIKNSVVNKTGDSTDNGDNVDFYGSNSAILVKKGSNANIENIEINTNSTGSNAIFVTNGEQNGDGNTNQNTQKNEKIMGEMPDNNKPPEIPDSDNNKEGEMPENINMENNQMSEDYSDGGASATISNVIINTYQDKSRGIDATYGGTITVEDTKINTRGGSCAAIATDRGEGTIVASHCELNTGVDNGIGRGSPCIYSTGNISLSNSIGTSYASQIACIEGKNSITLDKCELTCNAGGNREENGEFVDLGGFFIYQSMSGDANIGTALLNAYDSTLSISEDSEHYSTAPMIHVTNTKAVANINNCEFKFGSGTLLNVSGQNQWGNVGSNGGDLELNSVENDLNGNIFIDTISSLNLNLDKTEYTGTINPTDNYGVTNLTIDDGSTWILTGDSHITNLINDGKIEYGNYTLYVNGEAYTEANPYQ